MSEMHRTGWVTLVLAAVGLSLGGCGSKNSNNGQQSNANMGGQASGGATSGVCEQGLTRTCVGPGACQGAQSCQTDLTWTVCDCGSQGNGGANSAGSSGVTNTGGSAANAGGNSTAGGAGNTGGGVSTTGGAISNVGGTSASATGGAVSTGGTAATGGAPVSVGGTSAAGGGTTSPYITETNGWAVDPAHSVSGPLYTFTDSGGSYIYPDCATGATCFGSTGPTTQFCASGTAAMALDASGYNCQLTSSSCNWSAYWGAALAINMNQAVNSTTPIAWDASAYTGITFSIAITSMPANLRLYVNLLDGTQYCYAITTSTTFTLNWGQLVTNCYDSTLTHTPLSGAALKQIQSFAWQVGTNASQAMPYNFCVNNVKIN